MEAKWCGWLVAGITETIEVRFGPQIAHHADKDGTHQDTVIGLCITPHLEHKHKLGCLHKSTCKTGQLGSMTDSPCYLYP
jgi:hypothetical protein